MRSISRVADVSINTVTKLLEQAGEAYFAIHQEYRSQREGEAHPVRQNLVVLPRQAKERRHRQGCTRRRWRCLFCRIHKTLRISPAMAAGITDRFWSLEDIVAKIDAIAPEPKARGP